MNQSFNGMEIERYIKRLFKLKESLYGFDASWNGQEVEIKSCVKWQRNGIGRNGKQNWCRGRYWIDNRAHKLLLDQRGLYIFVLYEEINCHIWINQIQIVNAIHINPLIGKGKNTKIYWNKVI